MPVVDNMPTPWPLPTKSMQKLSTTTSVAAANQAVQAASSGGGVVAAGEPMPAHDVANVRNVLTMLLGSVMANDVPKKREDTAKALEELYQKLTEGQVKTATSQKLMSLVKAIEAQDPQSARILQELYTMDWDQNKKWLMCLKRLVR